MFGHYDAKDELRADERAAHLLINMDDYRAAEARYGTNIEAIAQELEVMDYIVEAFERTLARIGDSVYVGAKLGHYAAKVVAA